jgi:hypothetical protein
VPKLVSAIGPVEPIRRGDVIRASYDPEWDEFVLTATTHNGTGQQVALPSWTELYRESPGFTTDELFRRGAQLSVKSRPVLLMGKRCRRSKDILVRAAALVRDDLRQRARGCSSTYRRHPGWFGQDEPTEMIAALRQFLSALIESERELHYAAPLFEGLARIEEAYTFCQYFALLLPTMWT